MSSDSLLTGMNDSLLKDCNDLLPTNILELIASKYRKSLLPKPILPELRTAIPYYNDVSPTSCLIYNFEYNNELYSIHYHDLSLPINQYIGRVLIQVCYKRQWICEISVRPRNFNVPYKNERTIEDSFHFRMNYYDSLTISNSQRYVAIIAVCTIAKKNNLDLFLDKRFVLKHRTFTIRELIRELRST